MNLLTLTAVEAQKLLTNGQTTSVQLVEAYLSQIEAHNHNGLHLNALISVAPREIALALARTLDEERQAGKLRGPLHGIPYITKDILVTHPETGFPTTCGCPSLRSAKAKRTAPVLQHLADKGMILLGKANLTELCGIKEKGNTLGWSPAGGQTQSPYVFGGLDTEDGIMTNSSITGSSSGTAAGVAAGFAPLGIGAECVGSIISPANRGGLYALKTKLGSINAEGCFIYADCLDCLGGMAKSVEDLNLFTSALMQRAELFDVSGGGQGLRVKFTDLAVTSSYYMTAWDEPVWKQLENGFHDVRNKMIKAGLNIVDSNGFPSYEVFDLPDDKSPFYEIAFYQISNTQFPAFFNEFEESEVRSVQDMIEWNEKHADLCLPPSHPKQGELHDLAANTRVKKEIDAIQEKMQSTVKEIFDKQFEEADVIVGLGDGLMCMYSSAAGLPIAALPYSTVKYSDKNERPFGLSAVARTEAELFRFMAAYDEAVKPTRPVPKPLLETRPN